MHRRKGSEWEILGNLEKGTGYAIVPKKREGYLHKRRKWPLKGWHKRYFLLDRGVLTYGKSPAEIARGRTHGRLDVGAAVISAKTEMLRIDIDDEEYIHHIKVNDRETFALWLEQLKQHRLYQQHQANISGTENSSKDDIFKTTSLPRGLNAAGPRSGPFIEFSNLDENLTAQLLNVQQQALSLALLVQRVEDEQNAALGVQSGNDDIQTKLMMSLNEK